MSHHETVSNFCTLRAAILYDSIDASVLAQGCILRCMIYKLNTHTVVRSSR